MAEIFQFDPQMLAWVDESGSNRRNSVWTYGYSLKGMRAVSHQLRVVEENVNGNVFARFVRTSLLPILNHLMGLSHSVVVMDNACLNLPLGQNCTDDCWSWCSPQISSPLLPRIKPDRTCIFKG